MLDITIPDSLFSFKTFDDNELWKIKGNNIAPK